MTTPSVRNEIISGREQANRTEALFRATIDRRMADTDDVVLKRAEKYFEFLRGNDETP